MLEEIFQEKVRRAENREDSFGEMHAKFAREAQAEARLVGEGLFSGVQCTSPRLSLSASADASACSGRHSELVLLLPRAVSLLQLRGHTHLTMHVPDGQM